MRDKRPVDELSIEELERILAIRKRDARQQQMNRMKRSGRVVASPESKAPAAPPAAGKNGGPAPVDNAPFALPVPPGTQPVTNGGPAPAAPPPARPLPPPVKQQSALYFDDEPGDIAGLSSARRDASWQRFVNAALLVVEIAAVIGIVYIAVVMMQSISTLQKETDAAQQLADAQRRATIPTIAPTPTVRLDDVVLPGGHIFNENNVPIINVAEIPAHLLPRVQSQLTQPVVNRPEPTSETARELIIPALNIRQTIIQGSDWEALRSGVGQVLNGALPGDSVGNVVLAAHNDIYGSLFEHLDQLQAGDTFQIRTDTRTYTYEITHWEIVEPTAVEVMDTVPGQATATLISCYPYRVNSHRIVVFAQRVNV